MGAECKNIYDLLWEKSLPEFMGNNFECDRNLLDLGQDRRMGLTLIGRYDDSVKGKVAEFLDGAKKIDGNQYYYNIDELHLTIMSIITCYDGYNLDQNIIPQYDALIREALENINSFKIKVSGITASPSCIMLQGFPMDNELQRLRDNLRDIFSKHPIQQTMDSRYSIKTAHSTVIRFKTNVCNTKEFIDYINSYRDFDFGTIEIKKIDFVCNDWYMSNSKLIKIKSYDLIDILA